MKMVLKLNVRRKLISKMFCMRYYTNSGLKSVFCLLTKYKYLLVYGVVVDGVLFIFVSQF